MVLESGGAEVGCGERRLRDIREKRAICVLNVMISSHFTLSQRQVKKRMMEQAGKWEQEEAEPSAHDERRSAFFQRHGGSLEGSSDGADADARIKG
jgi:hypothetical protein